MCLVTEQKEPKTAGNDIRVYKWVKVHMDRLLPSGWMQSQLYGFLYEMNKLYETEIKATPYDIGIRFYPDNMINPYYDTISRDHYECNISKNDLIIIGPGFHAIRDVNRRNENDFQILQLVGCIIPKGSLYYEDATGLIVSNKIIINRIYPSLEQARNDNKEENTIV